MITHLESGTPERIRTSDLLLRRQTLKLSKSRKLLHRLQQCDADVCKKSAHVAVKADNKTDPTFSAIIDRAITGQPDWDAFFGAQSGGGE